MTEKVPGRPLNYGHRRVVSTRNSDPLTTPPSSSSSSSSFDSTSRISPIPVGTPGFLRYCPEELFGGCYNKPRRDPPAPMSQMCLLQNCLLTEPESDRTVTSYAHNRIGTPQPGEKIWWPDERLDPLRVDRNRSGLVYERDNRKAILPWGNIDTFSDSGGRSYAPLDHPVHERTVKPPAKTKKSKRVCTGKRKGRSSLQTSYVQLLGESNGQRAVQAWAQALRRYKPASGRIDANLKKYRAETCRAPPASPPWTWQPGSLSAWPKWALKRRAEVLVAMFYGKEPLLWKRTSP